MKHCGEEKPRAYLDSELRRDAAIQALLIQSSTELRHRERLSWTETSASPVAGTYFATRAPLAAPGMVERAVYELRELLNGESVDRICEVWTAVERCLTEEELRELRPLVLSRLFPDDAAQVTRGRHGDSLLGGY